jgi:hypothetical protein
MGGSTVEDNGTDFTGFAAAEMEDIVFTLINTYRTTFQNFQKATTMNQK